MPTTRPKPAVCRVCGAVIAPGAPLGHCPQCLVKLGLLDASGDEARVPAEAAASSSQFGDYVLLRQIGRGGMGAVYEARHVHLHRSVALKVILDSALDSPVALRRFHIEAEAAARLDHPHIVPIYEFGARDGEPFLCMKLVQGDSLRVRLARGEYRGNHSTTTAGKGSAHDRQVAVARLMGKVARAVHHAHLHHVLHRDLKPGNILIDEQGEPYLTDFGLAKLLEAPPLQEGVPALTSSNAILGTPGYMSPEQASSGVLAPATDIYSLGTILYELLTGRPPFQASTPLETLRLVSEQPPRRPRLDQPEVDRDLETICLKCLEKNPAARYATAAALADDLERWLRHAPIRARPAGPVLRATRWVRRNPVGAGLIASLCLGLGVALGLLHAVNHARDDAVRERDKAKYGRNVLIQQEWRKLEREWSDTNKLTILIPSEVLSVLGNTRPTEESAGQVRRLSFGINVTEQPVKLATDYVPFLKWLEHELGARVESPVLVDLVLCKDSGVEYSVLLEGRADVQRMGALPYVIARRLRPGVQPVVCEDVGKQAVICVRRDLYEREGVTNLARLAGRRFALGGTNATVSLLAKAALARAGVTGTNLTIKHFVDMDADTLAKHAEIQAQRGQIYDLPIQRGHRDALQAVLKGLFDAGAARREYYEQAKHKGKGLVAIHYYEVPPDVYVARAGLEPEIVEAFRAVMLAIKDKELLNNLPLQPVQQFLPARDADYETLRHALTNEALLFPSNDQAEDQGKLVPTP